MTTEIISSLYSNSWSSYRWVLIIS